MHPATKLELEVREVGQIQAGEEAELHLGCKGVDVGETR